VYVNQAAVEEAEELVAEMAKRLKGKEGALVGCIADAWPEVAERIDEALVRHGWPDATIVVMCEKAAGRLALFLAFTRPHRDAEWHLDQSRTRIEDRGGFTYKWEVLVEKDGVKLVENKPRVLQRVAA
jgi:hypothetical protein